MSARSKRGRVLSSLKNPKTGGLEIYEMTPEEAEQAINHIIQIMEGLPVARPAKPKSTEGEAKRGVRHARRFVAKNPTQEDIQRVWEWTWDETEMGCGCSACQAYDRAYRKVLRRHLT